MKKLLLGLGMLLSGTVAKLVKEFFAGEVLCRYGSCRLGAGCAGSPPGQLISLRKTELSLPDGLCLMAGGVFSAL